MLLNFLLLTFFSLAGDGGELVDLKSLEFSFLLDMPHATDNNPTGKKWLSQERCILRKEAAEALIKAQKTFQLTGNRLKVQECYIPELVSRKLVSQRREKGMGFDFETYFSRGGAVALTVVDREGKEFIFPGQDYSGKKARFSGSASEKAAEGNLERLKLVMTKVGFESYPQAPWFFIYRGSRDWPFSNVPLRQVP